MAGEMAAAFAELNAACGNIVYEEDCLAAVNQVLAAGQRLAGAERDRVRARLDQIAADNPPVAPRIVEAAEAMGFPAR